MTQRAPSSKALSAASHLTCSLCCAWCNSYGVWPMVGASYVHHYIRLMIHLLSKCLDRYSHLTCSLCCEWCSSYGVWPTVGASYDASLHKISDTSTLQMSKPVIPPDMFFVLRVVQLLRGLANSGCILCHDASTLQMSRPVYVRNHQAYVCNHHALRSY